ncbi:MAG: hypothetical protein WD136_03750 [Cyanobium sp.]
MILDHVGNAHRHGLPIDEREWNLAGRRRHEGVSIPIKDCPLCFCSCPSAAQVCPDCGHLFLIQERNEQRRKSPSAGCRTYEQLLQREQERGYKSGWARHVWAARQRST